MTEDQKHTEKLQKLLDTIREGKEHVRNGSDKISWRKRVQEATKQLEAELFKGNER